jgi:pimeloyl-ACP methyl ester carboxylesterase
MLWFLRTISSLAALLLLAIAARRSLERPASVPPPGLGERDTLVDGVRWRSREAEGSGPETVVFLHGMFASSACWEKVLSTSAGGRPAIAVDLPGFGYSDRPWPYDHTVGGQAAHLLAFLDARGISHAVLVGNSLGGAVALFVAVAQPDRVRALVLVDAAWPGSRIPFTIQALRTPVVGEIEMELYVRPLMRLGLRQRLFANPANVTEEIVERYWRPVTVPGTRRAALAAVRSRVLGYETLMDRVRVPTLVIWGEEDRLLAVSDGRRLAAAIPAAHLVVLPHAGHIPQEEAPKEFSRAVTEFLNATRANR